MKIAVTGCSGSIGVRVVLRALEQGHSVRGLDHAAPSENAFQHLPRDALDVRFEFRPLDVRDFSATLDALRGCDAAVHLAAHRNPTDYLVQTHNE
jgi:nucleoside-diphosphate-sugar epimerase